MVPSPRLSAWLALLPAAAWAFQPLITDDTGTQGAAGNQLEASYVRVEDRAAGALSVTHELAFVYTRGITDTVDFYAALAREKVVPDAPGTTARGWSNPALGLKWRFHEDEAAKFSIAVKPEVRLAVPDEREARGIGTGRTSWGVNLIATKETGFGSVHANLVAERVNYSDDTLNAAERRNQFRLSVAPVWDVAEGWKLALDAGVMTNPDRSARARMGYVELGAVYSPGRDLDLAAGIVRNVSDGEVRTTTLTFAASWRFR
ncbi:MAG: transporter [Burkholderiales bacterium]|nr:transporter [Burkholderiales bacterium]